MRRRQNKRDARRDLNEADVFNAVIVDPIANSVRYAVGLGFTLQEIKHGIDMACVHAEAELEGRL